MAGSGKRVAATVLFLVALVALLVFYFLVFADARQLNDLPGVGAIEAIAIGVAVLFAIIALIMIIMLFKRGARDEEPEDAPYFIPPGEEEPAAFEEVEDDIVVYDVWRLPVASHAWGGLDDARTHSFYFPLNVESGVYVNDYIALDDHGTRLKLRTLLAGPPDISAQRFVVPEPAPQWQEPEPVEPTEEPEPMPEDWEPPTRRPERPSRVAGTDFMRELEQRFNEQPATQAVVQEAYYDYKGDIHEVIDVEGIGPVYAQKLQAAGVHTTARLCYEDPGKLAAKIGAPEKTVVAWQAMAQLMKVSGIGPQYAEALARAGIEGIDELKRRSASRIADQVNDYLAGLDVNVLGQRITERRVAGWQAAAKSMRRVRQPTPEE